MAILIAALLTFSMTASMMLIPNANAHSPPWTAPTYAFIDVAPNPAGVNQIVTVSFWLDKPVPTYNGAYGDRWYNFTVTVTTPNGSIKTLGPFTSSSLGGASTLYIPDAIGNYTFVFHFPGQTLAGNNPAPTGTVNSQYVGDYYQPSTSSPVTLVVQQQPAQYLPTNPLPTNYWTRPIYATNTAWYTISGNWLGLGAYSHAQTGEYNSSGNFNPYTTAPTTAHILWTKPLAFGGLIGGEFGASGSSNYYSTAQYEDKFQPIIMNGILYYTITPGSITSREGWAAVDLQTGQTIWTKNTNAVLRCGEIYNINTLDQYGGIAYLWSVGGPQNDEGTPSGSSYAMYDAMTGNFILNITNALPMTLVEADDGALCGYAINQTQHTLIFWNSSKDIMTYSPYLNLPVTSGVIGSGLWRPPQGATIPWAAGIEWSEPLATNISGAPISPPLGIIFITGGAIVLDSNSQSTSTSIQPGWEIEAGYSAETGQQLWLVNRTETPFTWIVPESATDGVYTVFDRETSSWYGYSATTGAQLWGPTVVPGNAWSYYGSGAGVSDPAYGNVYSWDLGGYAHSINITTGAINWTFQTGSSGANTLEGDWPFWVYRTATVAGGELFVPVGRAYVPPMFPGAQLYALNATTGNLVWTISGMFVMNCPAVSDGIMVTPNAYDNQIYAFGMGPSKTTVEAPNPVTSVGSPIVIQGTVTDISAGSQQNAVAANFPNGLPCVSDASMTQFMEAVYEQQPMPTNITGVPVTLSVTDSNHNTYDIGTTTTNALGTYGLTWTPIIAGNFTVTATFAGTQSYYGSSASTYFYASSPAPTAAPYPTPVTGLASTGTVMLGVAAIIIVIVICVAVLAVLMLRKRP